MHGELQVLLCLRLLATNVSADVQNRAVALSQDNVGNVKQLRELYESKERASRVSVELDAADALLLSLDYFEPFANDRRVFLDASA